MAILNLVCLLVWPSTSESSEPTCRSSLRAGMTTLNEGPSTGAFTGGLSLLDQARGSAAPRSGAGNRELA